jgi:hypothetical protein
MELVICGVGKRRKERKKKRKKQTIVCVEWVGGSNSLENITRNLSARFPVPALPAVPSPFA